MDGLECSEVALSDLERTHRIDAEFYRKEAIKITDMVTHRSCKPLTDMVTVSDGNHMIISDKFTEVGISYYRGQDIKTFFIENSNPICIDTASFNTPYMKRSHLNKGDILLSIVGTIGSLALVYSDKQSTCSCKLAILRPKAGVKAEVVATFLRSKYGQVQIKKLTRGAVQMGLILEDMEQLKVPVYTDTFQQTIQDIIVSAFNLENTSKQIYSYAEQLLLDELDMTDFTPSTEKVSVKNFSESFGLSGRLDAEFYQPFYDKYENMIKKNGYELAEDICSDINYGTVPTSPYTEDGSGVPYIKGMNIKNTLVDDSNLDRIVNTINLPSKYYTKRGDIIISQMGTVADCGVVTEEQENWVFASFTIRLRLKKNTEYNPYFIGLYIQLLAKPYYFYRYIAQASVRQNTDLPTVRKMIIPKLSIEKQNLIATKIQESFFLRKKSKELLEKAKQAVEMAIEKDEQTALNWLSNL